MAQLNGVRCGSCGLNAVVSGGRDRRFRSWTETMYCYPESSPKLANRQSLGGAHSVGVTNPLDGRQVNHAQDVVGQWGTPAISSWLTHAVNDGLPAE
jgi:hypothetical protein